MKTPGPGPRLARRGKSVGPSSGGDGARQKWQLTGCSRSSAPTGLIAMCIAFSEKRRLRKPCAKALFLNIWFLLPVAISYKRALPVKRTLLALWLLRVTDLPSMPNKIDVQRVDPLRRHHLGENLVGLVGAHSGADQAQPLAHAMDMRIDRHHRQVKVEHHYAGRRFGANARQGAQVMPAFFGREFGKSGGKVLRE